ASSNGPRPSVSRCSTREPPASAPRRNEPGDFPLFNPARLHMDAANKIFHRSLFLNGPAGRLEALLWTSGAAAPAMAGLVCHPHPLFRGTMHNKVVFRGAKSLHRAGLPVLRFNFRGVGLSEGQHDCGRGERDDVRSALDFLSAEFPGLPVVLAGFSFGAWVGLRVESLVTSLPEPKRLVFVEGADHFFTGKLDQVDRAIREWLASPSPER